MKKTIAILIAVGIIICMSPTAFSSTAVTGTFTPIPSGVSIACNKTAPTFGDINLGSSGTNVSFNVTNEGDVNCSVTMTAEDDPSTWDLVAGTASPATTNEYCVNMNPNASGYVDVYTEQTVTAGMNPAGMGWNYTHFDLRVFVSDYTNEGTPSEQTFYANLTAAAQS